VSPFEVLFAVWTYRSAEDDAFFLMSESVDHYAYEASDGCAENEN